MRDSYPFSAILPFWQRQSPTQRVFLLVGLGLVLVYGLAALLAPWFVGLGLPDPQEFLNHVPQQPPSPQHWFGTDRQGYDVLSRVIFGARVAWQVVLWATSLSLGIGLPLGAFSGYWGGKVDKTLLFLMDTLYTLPGLLLSLTVAFVVGRGVLNAAIALSIAYIPQYYRVIRNHTMSLKNELFVEAARALGASDLAILGRHLSRHLGRDLPVLVSVNSADAVLTLAGLGFLGLGLPPETPEWGHELAQALDSLPTGIWWTTLFPGLAMTGLVVGLSLVSEGLGEA
ncbi:MAG: ABC transporter permease [Gloeomargarita sp. SKYBB_i_bin120]|nr:ABC transporter permease [Gloeomargarita sp. SKYG98]MCS7291463.1 ABC transporter permease [Gloeomargarita sp. SKYB120]MDW8177023.1 ABC transporter permease [Gloeomargarita sp. SKYBB_i_bin120]